MIITIKRVFCIDREEARINLNGSSNKMNSPECVVMRLEVIFIPAAENSNIRQ